MNKCIVIVTCCLLGFSAWAQNKFSSYKSGKITRQENTLPFRIQYPIGFQTDKSYPVILFLHGSGERGNDNELQLVHGGALFASDEFRKNYPAVVIFPQCPIGERWDSRGEPESTQPLQLVMELMDSIQQLAYSRDSQFYVGGLSLGGMGTFELLSRRPDMFAAAFPICGRANMAKIPTYAQKVQLWVFHGAQDDVVLPSFSTDAVIALQKAGANPRYTLYGQANHNSWDSAFAEPELIPWLFANRKK